MRPYANNSPAAIARLIALALIADGTLNRLELLPLKKLRRYPALHLNETILLAAVGEVCEDLLEQSQQSVASECQLTGAQLALMFDQVTHTNCRQDICRLVFDVIRADKRVHPNESSVLWQMLDHWGLRLSDIVKRNVIERLNLTPRQLKTHSRQITQHLFRPLAY